MIHWGNNIEIWNSLDENCYKDSSKQENLLITLWNWIIIFWWIMFTFGAGLLRWWSNLAIICPFWIIFVSIWIILKKKWKNYRKSWNYEKILKVNNNKFVKFMVRFFQVLILLSFSIYFIYSDIYTKYSREIVSYKDSLIVLETKCLSSKDEILEEYNKYISWTTSIDNFQMLIDNNIKTCSNSRDEIILKWNRKWDSSLKDGVLAVVNKHIELYSKIWEMIIYLDEINYSDEYRQNYNKIYNDLYLLEEEIDSLSGGLKSIQYNFLKYHKDNYLKELD